MAVTQPRPNHILYQCAKFGDDRTSFNVIFLPMLRLGYSHTTPLASPLDADRANICCRPGHRVSAQDHRLAAALNAGQRRSSPCNATCRKPSPK